MRVSGMYCENSFLRIALRSEIRYMLAFKRTSTTFSRDDNSAFGILAFTACLALCDFVLFFFFTWRALAVTCMLRGMLFGRVHVWWLVTEGHWLFKRHRLVCNRCWSAYFRVECMCARSVRSVYVKMCIRPEWTSAMRDETSAGFRNTFLVRLKEFAIKY